MFRFRFRLITLLTVMTLIAIGAGAFGMYQRSVHAERRALTKISHKGAFIYVYHGDDAGALYFPDPNVPQLGLCGTGLIALYAPEGSRQNFTDADLTLFDDVKTKFRIDFTGTSVTHAAAQRFKQQHPRFQVKL